MSEERMGRIAMGEIGNRYAVNRQSATWQAIRAFIKQQVAEDYLPALRRKGMDHGQTEYARGAMDALDSLLQFGGEDV